jgi:hypothetical protein
VGGVIGRNAHLDPVSFHHPNPLFLHPATEHALDEGIIVTFDLQSPSANHFLYHTFELDQIVSTQESSLKTVILVIQLSSDKRELYHTLSPLAREKPLQAVSTTLCDFSLFPHD